ncbi:sensor histidine kinase [Erythrobacter sp. F6033]|uniref:sensor histidine kinase n=1 Tax=Erythrobacter sp. F6033 TaxID=2926401 RepID=UPI001FF67B58|nr:sensor histidine kinase [Erythrobacter sp. F6033]MCK0129247.1 sensor histidine kinase [Erythrobacter sp. F6033]
MVRLIIFCFLILGAPAFAAPSAFAQFEHSDGQIIEFTQGQYSMAPGKIAPTSGFAPAATPNVYQINWEGWKFGDYHAVTGRFQIERTDLPDGPLALYTISTRDQFVVLINDAEVFRNFADVSNKKLSWNRPYFISLAPGTFKEGANTIEIRTVSQGSVGVGRLMVGDSAAVQSYYSSQYFWRITAPQIANYTMLLLGVLVFLFWIGRRHEIELLFLALSTFFWFARYYHFFAEDIPFDLQLFSDISENASLYGSWSTLAFYFYFIRARHVQNIVSGFFVMALSITVIQKVLGLDWTVYYLWSFLLSVAMALVGIASLWRNRNLEYGALGLAMAATPLFAIIDIYAAYQYGGSGGAIYLSVFMPFLYTFAFILSFGKRALDAFVSAENANTVLESRIAETRAELAESEEARQQLRVEQAIATEHGRLMQEMHDGIGSNLVTALAVARQQDMPSSTVKVLSNALNDLKLTVDSLEPVEGDVVALIGNLRHRMAADLKAAAIECKWEVEPCGNLPWLDATNALHVLRIFQEAISNAVAHSKASVMSIGCKEAQHDDVSGVEVHIIDNGVGFAPDTVSQGKGLTSMNARAEALHGVLRRHSSIGSGTQITLWLPYKRSR